MIGLRGAPVRDALNWSKYIGEALFRFGLEADVMFASHHWPRWGNERVQEVLRGQRDIYAQEPVTVRVAPQNFSVMLTRHINFRRSFLSSRFAQQRGRTKHGRRG